MLHTSERGTPYNSLYGKAPHEKSYFFRLQAPVVRKLDSAIHRINRYPAVKYYDNQLRYPVDSDLSSG